MNENIKALCGIRVIDNCSDAYNLVGILNSRGTVGTININKTADFS